MKIMGIDPGLSGGIAFYDGTTLEVVATPVVVEEFMKNGKKAKRNLMDLDKVRDLIEQHKPDRAVLEKVAARSGQGVTSMFRFGMNFGEHRGVMTALRVRFVEVTPQMWKRDYRLNSDKDDSLDLAREVFPDHAKTSFKLKKHDGLAEAALIAKFGFDNPEVFG
jgi:hypothetical protein